MRVLNILQGTSLGGMEQSSLALMKSMTSIGFKFEVLSLTPFGALKLKLDDLNITSYDCQYKGMGGWKSFFEIRSKIHSSNAESIMMTGHSLIGMLALGRKCKGNRHLAIHFHHQGVKNFYVWKLIYFLACKKFNTITFASDFIRQEAINIYKKVERMSLVIHNPIEAKKEQNLKLKALSRTKFGLPGDAIIFGNAGWLIKRKRFDVFIHLASKIKNKYPSAKFLIAGDGEEKERLVELASSLKIQDDIIWLGWQDNLEDFYNIESSYDKLPSTFDMAMSYKVSGATLALTYTSHNFRYDDLSIGGEYELMGMVYLRGGMSIPMLEENSVQEDEILTGFNFFLALILIEKLSFFISQPIFFKISNSFGKCFGFILLTLTLPLVIAPTHK